MDIIKHNSLLLQPVQLFIYLVLKSSMTTNANVLLYTTFSTSTGSCPLLCGGHGDYVNGECDCQPGWKGKECSLRHDECEISDCSGHGHCQEGRCVCMKGFTGEFCQKGTQLIINLCEYSLIVPTYKDISRYTSVVSNVGISFQVHNNTIKCNSLIGT